MNRVDRMLIKASEQSISQQADVFIVTYYPKGDRPHAGQWEVLFHVRKRHSNELETIKNYFNTEKEAFDSIETMKNAFPSLWDKAGKEPVVIYDNVGLAMEQRQAQEQAQAEAGDCIA